MKKVDFDLIAIVILLYLVLGYSEGWLIAIPITLFYTVLAFLYFGIFEILGGLVRGSGGRILCLHKYKLVQRKDLQGGFFDECTKCGRVKEW